MGNEKQGSGTSGRPAVEQESAVLGFLESELATSAPNRPESKAQSDDVDALVSSLLEQAISESGQPKPSHQVNVDDVNDLISGILQDPSSPSTGPLMEPSAVGDAQPKTASGQAGIQGDRGPGSILAPGAPPASPAADTPADNSSASSKAELTPNPAPLQGAAKSPAGLGSKGAVPLFTISPPKPSPKEKVLILCAAVALGLAVIGFPVYYLARSTPNSTATPPGSGVQALAPAAGVTTAVGPAQMPGVRRQPGAADTASPVRLPEEAPVALSPRVSVTPTRQAASPQSRYSRASQPPLPSPVGPEVPQPPPSVPEETAPSQPAVAAPTIPQTQILAQDAVHESPVLAATSRSLPALSPNPRVASGLVNPVAEGPRVNPPVAIHKVAPNYPEFAKRLGMKATVVMQLEIDERGRVVKVTPVSGPALLYAAAEAAVLKWRFQPASLNGINVASQSRVSMFFNYP